MDELSYTYTGNQLTAVADAGIDTVGFRDGNVLTDYAYDVNGNMIFDLNKDVDVIRYNQLNLPDTVVKETGEYITYTYDATGRKLTQRVFNSSDSLIKTTSYLGAFFYENDTLKFINHAEGRVVMEGAQPEYQYHLKDHLGNVRMTFTAKEEVESTTATLEAANLAEEQGEFLRYENARRVQATLFDHTNGSSTGYSQRLNGTANEIYGLARSISVMPGDTVRAEVFAKYVDEESGNWTQPLVDLMSAIANNTGGIVMDGGNYSASTSSFSYGGFVNTNSSSGSAPKAFLTWIVFDRDFNVLNGGFEQVSGAAKESGNDGPHERLHYDSIFIRQPGYVYIYLSNENGDPVEVFWDDFRVEHVKSPVVQVEDYYPFGLTFNSYQRENGLENKFRFQGQEHIDDLDLGWDSFKWRNHQPDIGRFFDLDPLAEDYYYNSPYAFSENKVTNHIELEGLEAHPAQQALTDQIKKVEDVVMPVVNKVSDGVTSVINTVGDGIASVWNSLAPGDDRGGSIWTTKEHSGGDQSDLPDGQADGGGNVDALIAPTLRSSPATNAAEGVAQGVEMATFVESKTHVIENVMKETGGNTTTIQVKDVTDTFDTKNFIFYQVTTTNGKDSAVQVSKTPDKQDDHKK